MYTNEITKMDSRFFFCLGEIIHESTLASVPKHTYALHHCNQNTIQLRILNFGRKKRCMQNSRNGGGGGGTAQYFCYAQMGTI